MNDVAKAEHRVNRQPDGSYETNDDGRTGGVQMLVPGDPLLDEQVYGDPNPITYAQAYAEAVGAAPAKPPAGDGDGSGG